MHALTAALLVMGCLSGATAAADESNSCVLIDNDYDIDDMMAMPLVVGNRNVAAVIQTEGYTFPSEGARAVDELINGPVGARDQFPIKVIAGGQQAQTPDVTPWPWLPFLRSMMSRSNGLFAAPPSPWPLDPVYPLSVAGAVAACQSVTVLLLGPYTSFINYSPLIRDKIGSVVVMGQAIGDESRTPGRESFNCRYDFAACQLGLGQLADLNTLFVDIPRGDHCFDGGLPEADCYTPSYEMVAGHDGQGGLTDQGIAGRLKRALINDIDCADLLAPLVPVVPGSACTSAATWAPLEHADIVGGEMLLWDQTAALAVLYPELFSPYHPPGEPATGGKHFEPTLVNNSDSQTVDRLRALWTEATNVAGAVR